MTGNYVILLEQPTYLNIPGLMRAKLFGKAGGKVEGLVVANKNEQVGIV